MKVIRQTFLLLTLALGLTAISSPWLLPKPLGLPEGINWITKKELQDIENYILIDSRSKEEYAEAHIPGAILINEMDYNSGFNRLLDKWEPEAKLIVYCSSKSCGSSETIGFRLRSDLAINNIYLLEGGWEAWLAYNPN